MGVSKSVECIWRSVIKMRSSYIKLDEEENVRVYLIRG